MGTLTSQPLFYQNITEKKKKKKPKPKTAKLSVAECQKQGTWGKCFVGYKVLLRSCLDSETDMLCVCWQAASPLWASVSSSLTALRGRAVGCGGSCDIHQSSVNRGAWQRTVAGGLGVFWNIRQPN